MRLIKGKDGKVNEIWEKGLDVSADEMHTYMEANLRSSYEDEIIFDAESSGEAELTKNLLLKDGISFTEWDTHSRGKHFHTRWKGLDTLDSNHREYYRWVMINKNNFLRYILKRCKENKDIKPYLYAIDKLSSYNTYHTDDCLRTDDHFVAMENRPHLKSGLHKSLVDSRGTIYNNIDVELLTIIKNIYISVNIRKKYDSKFSEDTDISELRRRISPTDLFKKWGYFNTKGNRHNPFWRHSASKAGVQLNPETAYDYSDAKAYNIFALTMMQHNCTFVEALEKLKSGNY